MPFWWITVKCLPAWAIAVSLIIFIFYCVDRNNFLKTPKKIREKTPHEKLKIEGLHNAGWLAVILCSVFLKNPLGLREVLMVIAAAGSYKTTLQPVHDANHFSFTPIKEVAWLFSGIFATMVPVLDYLECHATDLGITSPLHFYWCSGALNGVLDNAPTLLPIMSIIRGRDDVGIMRPISILLSAPIPGKARRPHAHAIWPPAAVAHDLDPTRR